MKITLHTYGVLATAHLLNVKKLNPGHALIKRWSIKRHWNWYRLPLKFTSDKIKSYKDILNKTEIHLRKATHKQLIADVPVGAFLSGELDPTSIVCFAKELAPDISCFTIKTKGDVEKGVIIQHARTAANFLKVPLNIVEIDSSKMANDLEEMIFQLDEPLADPAPLNVLYIQLAKRRELKYCFLALVEMICFQATGDIELFH